MQQRSTHDRRSRLTGIRYPLRDSDGELVCEDRRKLTDRRLAAIELEWLEMARESDSAGWSESRG